MSVTTQAHGGLVFIVTSHPNTAHARVYRTFNYTLDGPVIRFEEDQGFTVVLASIPFTVHSEHVVK